ncbi:hypothetical protein C370_00980 [Cryptococcus neoformans A1-35-8]|nr:hypothetical protein C369_00989 [Cryptococcus neoformans var. grubii A5-35-17]OXH19211.1 hypothetical protein C370_00980 [Cryptococcus neoformans var. grubii A1-35-8]
MLFTSSPPILNIGYTPKVFECNSRRPTKSPGTHISTLHPSLQPLTFHERSEAKLQNTIYSSHHISPSHTSPTEKPPETRYVRDKSIEQGLSLSGS